MPGFGATIIKRDVSADFEKAREDLQEAMSHRDNSKALEMLKELLKDSPDLNKAVALFEKKQTMQAELIHRVKETMGMKVADQSITEPGQSMGGRRG